MSDPQVLQDLEAAVRSNHTITKLVISASTTLDVPAAPATAVTPNIVHEIHRHFQMIIESLSALPCLTQVEVQLIHETNFTAVIGPALTKLFCKAQRLQQVGLTRVSFDGDDLENIFQEWGQALAHHSSLQEFSLELCSIPDSHRFSFLFNPVLLSLSKLSTLSKLCLIGTPHSMGLFSFSALLEVCHNCRPKMTHLECHGWDMPILQALSFFATNQIYYWKTLQVDFLPTNQREWSGLVTLLQQETSSLQFLQLYLMGTTSSLLGDDNNNNNHNGITQLAQVLQHHNRTLQSLVFRGGESAASTSITPDSTIPGCSLQEIPQPFVDALEVNFTLQHLELPGHDNLCLHTTNTNNMSQQNDTQQGRLEFYLYLNRHGRGELLQSDDNCIACKRRWVEHLIQCKDDLSSLWYYLLANPSLCGKRAKTS